MTPHEDLVSVIVPTLGRDSLHDAVSSALRQNVRTELIIVNDSGQPLPADGILAQARVIDTEGRCGPAHARNLGMKAASGGFIALLDDDDIWLRGHLEHAITALLEHPAADIYSCRGLLVYSPERSRLEPIELVGDRSMSEYFFGLDTWRSRCRRVLTPTLVFRSHLADLPMDPSLRMSEDTWWLLTAERTRGARMVQSSNVGVVVHAAPEREASRLRERRGGDVAWAVRLDGLVPGAGAGYLASGRARVAVRGGAPGEVCGLGRSAVGLVGGWRWVPAVVVQVVVASGVWLRERGKRLVRW